jgi:selenide, water dikinase
LLVGLGDPDDAAVWRLDQERALVVTTDFFTPVVDDPFDYGAIAAANSLSDIYAMGGKPFLALNVAAIPPSLPINISSEILRGGAEKCLEAGVVLAGGHTIQDQEPKYGLIVLGFVDPEKMITKSGAKPRDALVITKPLGFGTLTTAIKMAKAKPEEIIEVVKWMKFLNKEASEIAVECGVHGGTDVTGFSLLGHGLELANTSKVGLRFYFHKIPFLNGAKESANDYVFPGGTADNRLYFGLQTTFSASIDEPSQMLLFDAQTSGGLLLAVPQEKISAFLKKAQERDQKMWVIGEVIEGHGIQVLE